MSISGVPPPLPVAEKKPEWACDNFFQCSLVNSDVLLSAPTEVETGTEEILAAFFYEVPAEAGNKNLGLVLACADLTLYAVLDGLPKTFTALKQVCLPYGGVADVPASGKGGSVLWSDKSIQRILQYDRLGPNDVAPHMMRYARYVSYLATPSFAGLPAVVEELMGTGGETGGVDGRGDVGGTDSGLVPLDEAGGGTEFHGDFSMIVCGGHRVNLSRKFKARAFLRFLHGSLKGVPDKKFYVEEMRDRFNAQFGTGRHRGKWVSERFREDLFKGVGRKDFDLLFETVDGGAGLYRLRG